MSTQNFSILIIAVVAGALFSAHAGAAELAPQPTLILADFEVADQRAFERPGFHRWRGQPECRRRGRRGRAE